MLTCLYIVIENRIPSLSVDRKGLNVVQNQVFHCLMYVELTFNLKCHVAFIFGVTCTLMVN